MAAQDVIRLASAVLAVCYLVTPVLLIYWVQKRRDLPYRGAVLCFAVFSLVRCAANTLAALGLFSEPSGYRAGLMAVLAVLAVTLTVMLIRRMPDLLGLPTREAMRRTTETLDATLRKVTELERQKIEAQFMANVSHDLRTPIAAIRGYSETLLKGGLADERNRTEFVRIIQRNAERIGSLVENLLSLTTVDAAQTKRLSVDLELAGFVDDVVADLAPAARRRHVEMVNAVIDGVTVRAQDQQLWQILQNLVGNAIKFTPRAGRVEIRARELDDVVEISVADTGPGIDPAQLPLLFDRFHSRRQGKPVDKGSGLGLTIVRALVEAHGGRVDVESHPGVGTTFRFTLPRAARASQAAAR